MEATCKVGQIEEKDLLMLDAKTETPAYEISTEEKFDQVQNKDCTDIKTEEQMEVDSDRFSTTPEPQKTGEISDTDSAFSSGSSSNGNTKFYVSKICWGSFSKSSWYPCMIYPLESSEAETAKAKGTIYVKYFSWGGFTAHLPAKNVFEFGEMTEFWRELLEVRKIKRSLVRPFSKTILRGIEEAKFFKTVPIDLRIQLIDTIVLLGIRFKKGELVNIDLQKEVIPELVEYVKLFFEKMKDYDERVKLIPKRIAVRKSSVKSEPTSENSFEKARHSMRAVKKRKLENIEAFSVKREKTPKSECSETPPPKKRKLEAANEETLEEKFLMKDPNLVFRNVPKRKICAECCSVREEEVYRCSGKLCAGWFHASCCGSFQIKQEQLVHQTGDLEENGVNAKTPELLCKSCISNITKCFVCQGLIDENSKSLRCSNAECKLLYHVKCLENYPQTGHGKAKQNFLCPQHCCHMCSLKKIYITGTLSRCMKCPATYHMNVTCLPAGTEVLSRNHIICPRHKVKEEEEMNKKNAVKPLNLDFCNVCTKAGTLICCDGCPLSFHQECIENYTPQESFLCSECTSGKLPLYNTIVWTRCGPYRWWPGFVMVPDSIPIAVLEKQKYAREFCIRFFGSFDFFWTTHERVVSNENYFEFTNPPANGSNSRLNEAFRNALAETDKLAKILSCNMPNENLKPKPYTKISQNRPVHPVKLNKTSEHAPETCNCKITDENPCSKYSNCLNMHLNIECDKNCPAGAKCENQKLRNRQDARLKIIKTENRGFGIVCLDNIPANTFISEYIGELIDSAELNRRMERKMKNMDREYYFFTIGPDLYVDAEPCGNLSRFINHSCEPNCDTRKITVDGNTRIGIFSNQAIKADTELSFDYAMEFADNRKTRCVCGSQKCSGIIGEKLKIEAPMKAPKVEKVKKRKLKKKKLSVKRKPVLTEEDIKAIENTVNPLELMMEDV